MGLYELTFHNCFNLHEDRISMKEIKMELTEMNGEHYLSTGEMPLPMVSFYPMEIAENIAYKSKEYFFVGY